MLRKAIPVSYNNIMSRLLLLASLILVCLAGPSWAWAQEPDALELGLEAVPSRAEADQRIEIRVSLTNRSGSKQQPGQVLIKAGEEALDRFTPPVLKPGEEYLRRLFWKASGSGRVRLEAVLAGARPAERWIEIEAGKPGRMDLALSWLATPPQGCLGQGPWTAQVGVVNKGTLPSREGGLLFLVNGKTADQARIPVLQPGQQLLISFVWQGARSGPNILAAELDQEGTLGDMDPSNNRITQEFIFKKCQPDLVPVSLKLEGKAEPGQRPARATAVIANLGGVAAEVFTVRFFIDGSEIGSFNLGRLESGRRRAVKIEWMATRPGTYTLAVEVETPPGVGELDPENNRRELRFTTLDDQPDLALERPKLPLNLCFNEDPVIIKAEVVNRGRKASPQSQVALRQGTRTLVQEKLEPLPPGGSAVVNLEWKPESPGSYRLFLVVDPVGRIDESNENNNDALIQIRLKDCRPDLIVSSVRVADRIGPDKDSRKVLFSIHNRGGSVSAKTKAVVQVDGEKVVELEVGPIQSSSSSPFEAILPDLEGGERRLRIVVDPEKKIDELNRRNNDYAKKIAVSAGRIDLAVLEVITEPAVLIPDKPFVIIARVANLGAGAGRVEVAFKMDGREIGRKFLSSLWAKAEKRVRLEVEQAPRDKVLIEAVVDPDNLIHEKNENNNSSSLPAAR